MVMKKNEQQQKERQYAPMSYPYIWQTSATSETSSRTAL